MSNIKTRQLLYSWLTGADYAAAVAAVNASTTTWSGIDIEVFAESHQTAVQETRQMPAVIIIPQSMSPLIHEHSGEVENGHVFDVIVIDISDNAQDALDKVMAHCWCVRHVVYANTSMNGRAYNATVDNITYSTNSTVPSGATVQQATVTVTINSLDSTTSLDD